MPDGFEQGTAGARLARASEAALGWPPVAIERIGLRGERAASEVLARAFRDGPMSRAVVGEDQARRLRSNRHGMRQSLRGARGRSLVLGAEEAGVPARTRLSPIGALLALPPGAFPLDPPSISAQLRSAFVQGVRVAARWGDVYRILETVHPGEPHWYLSLLGVDPPHQGRGVGRALLEDWLARVDATGDASYLETDLERNVAFYGRSGFAVRQEIDALGVRVFCLWRSGRRSGAAAALSARARDFA